MRLKSAKYIFLLLLFPFPLYAGGFIQVRSAIQISSTISDGKYSLYEIAETAKENGIKAVIFTDKGFMRWSYGLWPLRNIIKKTVENNSIFQYGIKHYLDNIEKIKRDFPNMVFVAGVDSSPFYYWRGSIFKNNLTICNWHKQLIAIGLDKPPDYANLPVIGNPRALRNGLDIFKLWPFITLFIGLFSLKLRMYSYRDSQGRELAPHSKALRTTGVIIIVLSVLFVLNNWPPLKAEFDAYHGDLKSVPYQNFIDYVNKKRGLAFWTHAGAENVSRRGRIKIETKRYPQELLYTHNYTGFTIFPAGYKEIGSPGGIWDTILKEYCSGKRKHPVWAIGTLAFDQQGDLANRMRNLSTVLLVRKLSKKEVINAFKKGRMYVMKGKNSASFLLDKFFIKDDISKEQGIVGDTVKLAGKPTLYIKGKFLDMPRKIELKIIKNGKIIKVYDVNTPFEITYDGDKSFSGKSYYRLEIRSSGLNFVTNPIFVVRK